MVDQQKPACLICLKEKAKYYGLFSKRSNLDDLRPNIQLLFQTPVNFELLRGKVICEHCLSITKFLPNIKLMITNAIDLESSKSKCTPYRVTDTKKRLASTPSELLHFKQTPEKRETVVSSLVKSFEKLKTVNTCTDATELYIRSKRKINFIDHTYGKDRTDILKDVEEGKDIEAVEQILNLNTDCEYGTLCLEINKQLSELKTDVGTLQNKNIFSACIIELNEKCAALLQVLIHAIGKHETVERKIATIATIYGMVLHSRNLRASSIQKIFSALLIRCHADNKLLHRLNCVHLTMSESSKRKIVKEFGEQLEEKLIKDMSDGNTGKINGDNLDIRVHTNDIRMSNKDRDYHFFASNFVLDRIHVDKGPALILEPEGPKLELFWPNDNEIKAYRNSLKILLGRIMIKYMPEFKWFEKILPDHIDHPHKEAMSKKSIVHMLPLSLNNECSYDGCVRIMDEYIEMINRWYRKAGRAAELDKLQIPFGGDQLTRIRFQGAKALRAGAHTPQERFDHLYPMIIELFHTLQDFLEKLCKRFLSLANSKEQGTLANLKIIIQWTNVNGKVKSRFKAHEDFVLTSGSAYFLDYMKKFKMNDLEDIPNQPAIPKNVKLLHTNNKQRIFDTIMDEVVGDIFLPYENEVTKKTDLKVTIANQEFVCTSTIDNQTAVVSLVINGRQVILQVPLPRLEEGYSFNLNGIPMFVKGVKKGNDDLYNYVLNFLQWYFVILQMNDSIHEGDITRTNIIMKTMIPFFYSHSSLSKYFTECVDFILKTEFTLPPHVAEMVRAAAFVNIHGGAGQNKAADLHKENEVKLVKDLIKGLGANKTEKSIVAISKAAPVIDDVTKNFDNMLKINDSNTKHKKRSSLEDIKAAICKIKPLNVWNFVENRLLASFSGISRSPFKFHRKDFLEQLRSTIFRLQRDLPCEADEDKDEDIEEEDAL